MRGKPRPSDLVAKQPLGEAAELGRGRIARTAKPSLPWLLVWRLLLFDVLANDANRSAATGCGEIGRRPKHVFPIPPLNVWTLATQPPTGCALEAVHWRRYRHFRRVLHQQVHMVTLAVHLDQRSLEVRADLGEHPAQAIYRITVEHFAPIFRHKDQMDMHLENAVPTVPNLVVIAHKPKYN